ncbi:MULTISPECIES: putative baseplate assembly protein [unclassified Streptomyces]|uniref:putative baseplate assembly protein n=1 Tax=Streptomyces sp. NPDC127532 TaxID=3345399 RepID=UPI0036275A48
MTLPSPHLDDRRFQDLVDEAKRLVQQRCPEWTDHNVSDPGVTLIEAFAAMVDQLVYRVNRVPEKNYLTFLDLIGVRLHPPTAAQTEVTFRLSAPQPDPVVVRAGTEVATLRTETEEAVVFTTSETLTVEPCAFAHLATWPSPGEAVDRTEELALGRDVACFGATPAPGDCLYVGLSAAVPAGVVVLRLDCRVEGVGVDPLRPPLLWEAWDGTAWTVCEVEKDDTGGFNRSGELILHLPKNHVPAAVVGRTGGWLRCRLIEAERGRPTYMAPPVVRRISAFTIGATVPAEHAETVTDEVLGAAEGVPGQVFTLARPPVVPGEFVVEVSDQAGGDGFTRWTQVDDFAHSGPEDRHITLDPNSGRVEFGPAVRERDGGIRYYGDFPDKGAIVRVRSYRTGGGLRGNVARSTLRVLRSAIPYVARVENRRPALGGVDGESVDSARVRGPMTLRTLHRAVVPHDYELLAREIAPDAARVHCIRAGEDGSGSGGSGSGGSGGSGGAVAEGGSAGANGGAEAGGVRLLVVPAGRSDEQGRIVFDELIPPAQTLGLIAGHLDARRPIGARLVVEPPFYQGVTVVATVQAERGAVVERVRETALAALYGYFNPLTGGPNGQGWPFGRPIQSGEAFAVLQRVPGVDLVEDVRLYPADPVTGERTEATTRIPLDRHALVFSYEHALRVREG